MDVLGPAKLSFVERCPVLGSLNNVYIRAVGSVWCSNGVLY